MHRHQFIGGVVVGLLLATVIFCITGVHNDRRLKNALANADSAMVDAETYYSYWHLARAVAVHLDGELARCRQPYDKANGDSVCIYAVVVRQRVDTPMVKRDTATSPTVARLLITVTPGPTRIQYGGFVPRDEYLRITGTEHLIPGIALIGKP